MELWRKAIFGICMIIVLGYLYCSNRELQSRMIEIENGQEAFKNQITSKLNSLQQMPFQVAPSKTQRFVETPSPTPLKKNNVIISELPTLQKNTMLMSNVKLDLSRIRSSFEALDQNTNGRVEILEAGVSNEVFEVFDWNTDGELDLKELERTQRFMVRMDDWAKRHDLGDGSFPIERDHYEGSKKLFTFSDKNGDQVLDEDEYFEVLRKSREELRRFDVDRNGEITLQEFGGNQKRFDTIDQNKNQVIEEYEVRDALAQGYW